MDKFIGAVLFLVGFMNFYPMVGVLSADRLAALYGVRVSGSDLLILMRHRAILFGILGAFLMFSAFEPSVRLFAISAGLASMLSFVILAMLIGEYGSHIRKIVLVDAAGSVALLIALLGICL